MIARKLTRLISIGIAGCLALVLSACTINIGSAKTDQTSTDASSERVTVEPTSDSETKDYLSKIKVFSKREAEILTKYDSVSGENFTNDQTMYSALIELIPEVQRFIADLEAITPTDASLAAIHKTIVDGWNLQSKGFTLTAAALAEQDISKIADANEALAQGRALLSVGSQKVASLK